MTSHAGPARRSSVEALSARAELGAVVRVGMAVVIGVWMYVAVTAGVSREPASGRRNFLPFQALVQDRAPAEQRMFRELQEGLIEAEARRSANGTWPDLAALTGDGIPPFAPDPTVKGPRLAWDLIQSGASVNYLGRPAQAGAPAWLVLIQEPDPGVPPDQSFEDEEHHRLASGAMLHVSVWIHTEGSRVVTRIIRAPQAEGWTQLYAVGPGRTNSSR
jgi:hypothetical protein